MDNFVRVINEELRKRVGLEKLYPYSLMPREREDFAGLAYLQAEEIMMTPSLRDEESIISIYLHEVGHLIANKAGIDEDSTGMNHNKHFACLVAVKYRRAGMLDRLRLYDFSDTHSRLNGEGPMPSDEELISRFTYIIERSAELAPLPLSIEQIAKKIYQEDVVPHLYSTKGHTNAKRDNFPLSCAFSYWGIGILTGAILGWLLFA